MKNIKKFILILCLVFLTSCGLLPKDEQVIVEPTKDAYYYMGKLRTYTPRIKTNNTNDNKEFDAFLEKVFVESMESDYLNMHFSVVDYKKYNIEKPPVDLGEIKYEFDNENYDYMENQLDELQSFDFNSLSLRQQYDYEALEYSLYETLASFFFYKYDFLFSEASCLPENLLSNYDGFTFYDKESVEDYLTCLKDVDRVIDDALAYTSNQFEDGYGLLDEWIDYTDNVVNNFAYSDDNQLVISFNSRIEKVTFLSDTEISNYKKQNEEIVVNEVVPAYIRIVSDLSQYYGKTSQEKYVLMSLDPLYAEYTYFISASDNSSVDDMFLRLTDTLDYLEAAYITCMYDASSSEKFDTYFYGDVDVFNLSNYDLLAFLNSNLGSCYPNLGDVDYEAELLDPDIAPDSAIAYYFPAPIDNSNQNIIRINPNNIEKGAGTYNTLAHEGFPGHLYQHIYYQKTNPATFRSVISFIGYTEGYAVNASYDAFRFLGIDDEYAALSLFLEKNYYFLTYSIIDIGVNYYGWDIQDIIDYFDDNSMIFMFDEESAAGIRSFLISMPGVYTSYGIGFANLMTLRLQTMEALGDRFDLVEYNDTILKNGPQPYVILKQAVNRYIENK